MKPIAALGTLGVCLAVAVAIQERPFRVERTVFLMGTRATFVVETVDRETGLAQLERMVRVIEDAEAELSTWRDDSAFSTLNRRPVDEPWQVSASLCAVLDELATWHRATDGAFDPAVGRLVAAWGLRAGGRQPSPNELEAASARTGFGHIALDRETCTVTRRADVALDAGGFGKGAALQRVRRAERRAPGAWLIDFGGQMAVSGEAGDGAWPVAIAHPTLRDVPALELLLGDGSLATSGGSERDLVIDGTATRIGHILDPRTGRPVSRRASVTVWHQDDFVADVLSTALYVIGPKEGLAWAEARGIAACFIVPEAGDDPDAVTVRATKAFRQRFELAATGRPR